MVSNNERRNVIKLAGLVHISTVYMSRKGVCVHTLRVKSPVIPHDGIDEAEAVEEVNTSEALVGLHERPVEFRA